MTKLDIWRPFCWPSWLSNKTHIQTWARVWQNLYSKLKKSLMEAINIFNLEEIRLKMTMLEWPGQCTQVQTDRWRPFCWPSWLSLDGQNPYSNLNESLMEAIHIWNLEDIWLKLTELEWPPTDGRTDRWKDKPKTIELRQQLLVGH